MISSRSANKLHFVYITTETRSGIIFVHCRIRSIFRQHVYSLIFMTSNRLVNAHCLLAKILQTIFLCGYIMYTVQLKMVSTCKKQQSSMYEDDFNRFEKNKLNVKCISENRYGEDVRKCTPFRLSH